MSFDDTIPTDKDFVRLLIGDVFEDEEFLSDATIFKILEDEGDNVLEAAITCTKLILAQTSRDASFQASTLRMESSDVFDHFERVLRHLRDQRDRGGIRPRFVSTEGVNKRDELLFAVGMMDNPPLSIDTDAEEGS